MGGAILAGLGLLVAFLLVYGDTTGGDRRLVGVATADADDVVVALYGCDDTAVQSIEVFDGSESFWRLEGDLTVDGLVTIDFRNPPPGLDLVAAPEPGSSGPSGVLEVLPSGTFMAIGISAAVDALAEAGADNHAIWSDGTLMDEKEFVERAREACS